MTKVTEFQTKIEALQRAFCAERQTEFVAAPPDLKSGFALSTKGQNPINGLRHPLEGDTTGWYLWCGEHFSDALDFFAPLHTSHIYEDYPKRRAAHS
jgi:hypothetical protein